MIYEYCYFWQLYDWPKVRNKIQKVYSCTMRVFPGTRTWTLDGLRFAEWMWGNILNAECFCFVVLKVLVWVLNDWILAYQLDGEYKLHLFRRIMDALMWLDGIQYCGIKYNRFHKPETHNTTQTVIIPDTSHDMLSIHSNTQRKYICIRHSNASKREISDRYEFIWKNTHTRKNPRHKNMRPCNTT